MSAAPRLAGPRVLAMVGDKSGPSLWRVLQPITALERAGYPCGWDFKDAVGLGDLAPLFDAYLLPRLSWQTAERPIAGAWFDMIHRAGRLAIYDADDDVFTSWLTARALEIGMHDGRSYAALEAERAERLWALRQCDGVTVSTQRLATIVRSLTTAPVVVVPNAIDLPWFRRVMKGVVRRTPAPTIGWAGGTRPDRDVAPMAEAWARVASRYSAVRFVIQGYLPPILASAVPEDRLVRLPWMPLERYPTGLVEVDIACCSVADEPFNRPKSPIKAYEAAAAGAAVVATPCVYGTTIEHEQTGYLAETAGDWEAALAALVERPAQRAIMARRLVRHVERHCSLAENLWRWPASWSTIAEHARARRGRAAAV